MPNNNSKSFKNEERKLGMFSSESHKQLPRPNLKFQQKSMRNLRITADVLKKQMKKGALFNFLFDFLSDSVTSFSNTAYFVIVFHLTFMFLTLLCSFSFAVPTNAFLTTLIGLVHYRPFDRGESFLSFPPFYFQIAIFLISLIGYVTFFFHLSNRFLGSILQNVFLFFCHALSIPLFSYSTMNMVAALVKFCLTGDTIFLVIPIIALFCLPSYFLGILRTILEIKILKLPFSNNNATNTFKFLLEMCLVLVLQTVTFFIDYKLEIVFINILIFIMTISNLYSLLVEPLFLSVYAQIIGLSMTFMFMWSSFTNMLFNYTKIPEIYLIMINTVLIIISIAFSTIYTLFLKAKWVRAKKISIFVDKNNSIKDNHIKNIDSKNNNNKNNSNIDDENLIIDNKNKKIKKNKKKVNKSNNSHRDLLLTLCFADPQKIECDPDSFNEILFRHSSSVELDLAILRFMYRKENWSNLIFESAVHLLMQNDYSLMNYVQLISLIEFTSEQVFFNNDEKVSKRQKQVDSILANCYQCQCEFWRSVLHSYIQNIPFCAYRLTKVIKNAENFFKQNNINEFSDDLYRAKYIEFITNVTVNISKVDRSTITKNQNPNQNNEQHQSPQQQQQQNQNRLQLPSINSNLNINLNNNNNMNTIKKENVKYLAPLSSAFPSLHQRTKSTIDVASSNQGKININDSNGNINIFNTNPNSNNNNNPNIIVGQKRNSQQQELFPQFDVVSSHLDQFSDKRIEVCEAANKYQFTRQKCRNISVKVIISVIFMLSIVTASVYFVFMSRPFAEFLKLSDFIEVQFPLFDSAFIFLHDYLLFLFDENPQTDEKELIKFLENSSTAIMALIDDHGSFGVFDKQSINESYYSMIKFLNGEMTYFQVCDSLINTSNNIIDYHYQKEEILNHYMENYTDHIINLSYIFVIIFIIVLTTLIIMFIDQTAMINKLCHQPNLISKKEVAILYKKYSQISPNSSNCSSLIGKSNNTSSLSSGSGSGSNGSSFYSHSFSFVFLFNFKFFFLIILSFVFHFAFILIGQMIHKKIAEQDISVHNIMTIIPIIRTSLFYIALINFDRDKIDAVKGNIQKLYFALQDFNIETDRQVLWNETTNEGVTPVIVKNIYPLQSMHFWPLNNKTISIDLMDYMAQLSVIMFEIRFPIADGIYQSSIIPLLQFPLRINYMKESIQQSFSYQSQLTLLGAILNFIIYLILEILIFFALLIMSYNINKTFSLMARILSLIPQKSPFFTIPLNLERDKPPLKVVEDQIVEILPNGIVFVDTKSQRIKKLNEFALDVFGQEKLGKTIENIPETLIDSNTGKKKYFSISPTIRAQNPIDGYGRCYFDDNTLCYIVNDITKIKKVKTQIEFMKKESNALKNVLLPNSIGVVHSELVKMIGKFAVVEIALSENFKNFELFESETSKIADQFSTLIIFNQKRWSFFAIFGSFSTGGNSRQFIREAFTFVTKVIGFSYEYAKASMILGDRCVFMVELSDKMHFEMFSPALMSSSALLRCGNVGEIVSEYGIFKFLQNSAVQILRSGIITILNDEIEFAVISIQV